PGTGAQDTTDKKHADASVEIAQSDAFVFCARFTMTVARLGGWDATVVGPTLMFWRAVESSSPFDHNILIGDVDVTRGWAASPTGTAQYVDGAANGIGLGNVCSVLRDTSPFIAVHGYHHDGDVDASRFDDLLVVPFEIPADWAPDIYAFADDNAL